MTRLLPVLALTLLATPVQAQLPDINDLHQQATKAAAKAAAPSVVQITTTGGADLIVAGPKGATFRKALGPTTGVIVSSDGYIISSAFNFVNQPTNILVAVPGHQEPYVAKRVATDKSRMLTLIKIDAKNLPVPAYVPKKELSVGQWAIALGRTLDLQRDSPPSISVGIISALGRIWGKAIQTDAKVSPVNYGGPLIDMQGRVQAILIPASPQGEDETAGFEWYDSGIGFGVPFEDVLAVLPRLKQGRDLNKGLLGVRFKSPDIYSGTTEIAEVTANSAAAKAGLKAGDFITEIDGKPVVRLAQVMHALGPKYEGDRIALKYRRGKNEVAIAALELVGKMTAYSHPFLGILPMRDDPKLGLEIRHVYAKSPADVAGLKPGDRIVRYGPAEKPELNNFKGQFPGRDEFTDFLNTLTPGSEIKLEVVRKEGGKKEIVTVRLDVLPGSTKDSKDAPPEKLPAVSSLKKALEPLEPGPGQPKPAKVDPQAKEKPKTGLVKKDSANGEHKYWVYVHEDYDPNVSHGLVLWLHPPGQNKEEDFDKLAETWDEYCAQHNLLLVFPKSDNVNGWIPSDAAWVQEILREVVAAYTVDRQRIVAHGLGIGGQLAFYLGFNDRDMIRGVATVGAVATQIKDNVAARRLSFFLVGGDRDPLAQAIAESRTKLAERRYPAIHREIANIGRQYLDERTLAELARWIDTLDRQ